MRNFGFGKHQRDDPWERAPEWAIELGEMQFILMLQNEAILAALERRASKLSPKDQETLNTIFDVSEATTKRIEDAQKP